MRRGMVSVMTMELCRVVNAIVCRVRGCVRAQAGHMRLDEPRGGERCPAAVPGRLQGLRRPLRTPAWPDLKGGVLLRASLLFTKT